MTGKNGKFLCPVTNHIVNKNDTRERPLSVDRNLDRAESSGVSQKRGESLQKKKKLFLQCSKKCRMQVFIILIFKSDSDVLGNRNEAKMEL